MSNNTETTRTGIGFFGILGIVFIVLKLTHVIDWPWIWVTAPLWGPAAITIAFVLLVVAIKAICNAAKR